MNQVATLVRREFWEHRSLWIAPAVAAGVLLLLSLVGAVVARQHFGVDGPVAGFGFRSRVAGAAPMLGLASQIFIVASIAAIAYLLDCLYAERKDRSILFWKSLPVSDAKTVLAKYFVAMLVVPLGAWLLAAATWLVVHAAFALLAPQVADAAGIPFTRMPGLLAGLLGMVLVSVLWYAPVAAFLMLASVLARRSPWLIVSLLPVGLMLVEGMLFQTRYVITFIGQRLQPVIDPLAGLQRPGLWLGLVAAAGMLYIVVRLRRYRDDT